jgi:hypothetical protein
MAVANNAGRAALDAMITRQAQIIAYVDDFKLLIIATPAVIPHLIDPLRGLREAAPPRLLVILGASGAGKSSFLRAGRWTSSRDTRSQVRSSQHRSDCCNGVGLSNQTESQIARRLADSKAGATWVAGIRVSATGHQLYRTIVCSSIFPCHQVERP